MVAATGRQVLLAKQPPALLPLQQGRERLAVPGVVAWVVLLETVAEICRKCSLACR